MDAVTTAAPASPAAPARTTRRLATLGNVALALLAHVAVGASWALTAVAVMGSLDVVRRMAMNSEFHASAGEDAGRGRALELPSTVPNPPAATGT
jgi:hypothetical protein